MAKERIVQHIDEIDETLAHERYVLLYLYANDCGVCDVFRGKLKEALAERNEIVMLSVHLQQIPMAAGRFLAFSPPCVLFFVDGKESLRSCGVMSLSSVTERVDRLLELSADASFGPENR